MALRRTADVLAIGSLLACGAVAWCQTGRGTDDGARKLVTAERQVIARSAAWGYLASLADGSVGMTYSRATAVTECDGTYVAFEWIRTTGDGGIIVTYYTMPSTSNYHDLWNQAAIHTVRFTEEQLRAAAGGS